MAPTMVRAAQNSWPLGFRVCRILLIGIIPIIITITNIIHIVNIINMNNIIKGATCGSRIKAYNFEPTPPVTASESILPHTCKAGPNDSLCSRSLDSNFFGHMIWRGSIRRIKRVWDFAVGPSSGSNIPEVAENSKKPAIRSLSLA